MQKKWIYIYIQYTHTYIYMKKYIHYHNFVYIPTIALANPILSNNPTWRQITSLLCLNWLVYILDFCWIFLTTSLKYNTTKYASGTPNIIIFWKCSPNYAGRIMETNHEEKAGHVDKLPPCPTFLQCPAILGRKLLFRHFLADRIEFFWIQQMGSDSVKISFPSTQMIETKRPAFVCRALVRALFSPMELQGKSTFLRGITRSGHKDGTLKVGESTSHPEKRFHFGWRDSLND